VGGAGVQRPARFVRYLREHGYEPIVVTGPGTASGRWTPADETLVAEVPADVEVHRVPAPEPPQEGRTEQLERWLRVPSPWSRWWVSGAARLGRAVGREAELVYTWMQPYQTATAGARLARGLGRPWVADLGDPWAFDEMIAYPSRLHRRLEARRMGALLGRADAVVMSTPEAARRIVEGFAGFERKLVRAIPNGYDPSDFAGARPARLPDRFRIVHTGYLHTELGLRYRRFGAVRRLLGGTVAGVDVLPRSHVYLLQAVERLLARRPDLRGRVEVVLAGVLSAADLDVARRYDFVVTPGYVTHGEAVDLMRGADMLFLPMHEVEEGRATIVPGKTYEYLAARVPVLAAVPDGDVRDVLAAGGRTVFCRPRDVAAMTDAVERAADGAAPEPEDELELERYAYPALAAELASLFDEVLAARS
jgi:glycosyltransferase involved in cell wall biosynthesis